MEGTTAKISEPQKAKSKPIPKQIININKQFTYTFGCWLVENPSLKFQIYRTTIFLTSLSLTIFWPIQNILINYLLVAAAWAVIVHIEKPIPRFFTLFNIMLTMATIYYTMKIFIH